MRSDLRTLVWLQWKRFKGSATYWLRLIGFEPDANRFYLLYAALFWLFWVYTVWAFVVQQVEQISQSISPASAIQLQAGVPALILMAQLVYLGMVLRNSPLKLDAAEIEFVAASPVNRGSFVLVHFGRSVLLLALFAGLASCLLAMLLTWQSAPAKVGVVGLQAWVLGIPIFGLSAALAWIVVLLKERLVSRWLKRAVWLILPLAVVLAVALPQVMLFPGALWLTALDAGSSAAALASSGLLLGLAGVLLALIGSRLNMAAVADDSRMYARVQKLGIFGRLYADDVISSVQRQSRLARKKHLRLRLPEPATGYAIILNRALLSLFRLAPSSLFRLIMRGVVLVGIVSLGVQFGGWAQLQTWLLLLMILIQFRPTELNILFQQDVGQAFTRQFLPSNPLRLALADGIFPISLASMGGVGALLLQGWVDPLAALVVVLALIVGLEFCQALELVSVPGLFFRRIPYTYSVALSGIALLATGLLLRSPIAIVSAIIMVDLILATLLARSHF